MKEIIKTGKPRSEVRKVYRFVCNSCEGEFISDEYEWAHIPCGVTITTTLKSQCPNCDYTATASGEYNK